MGKGLSSIILINMCVIFLSCNKTESDDFYFDDAESLENYVRKCGESIAYDDSLAFQKAVSASVMSSNRDKSIGVFGGSLSCRAESKFAKYLWAKYLGLRIYTYGMNGYGFARSQGSIQDQVDRASEHDIYVLWASTNDYTNDKPIGIYTDYTALDNYDDSKLDTQCGGMNYCINKLRQKNPSAEIFVFCSLPFFQYPGGYKRETTNCNNLGATFYQYIEAQKLVAEYNGVKYFNQFDIPLLTVENSKSYYMEDKYHLTARGYANIGIYQLYFLSTKNELL